MKYENAAPEPCETPGDVRGSVVWQHPLQNARISMPCRTMSILAHEALRRFKAKPSSEIGGILWGKQALDSAEPATIIAEAQLVPSDGAFYNANPQDRARLARALKTPGNGGLTPVGYFRSHIREGLALSSEDQQFIQENMRDPNALLLLIRPFEIGICMGGFFFWENGRLQTDTSDLEVPFLDTGDYSGQNPPSADVYNPPAAVVPVKPRLEEPAPVPAPQPPAPEPVPVSARKPWAARFGSLRIAGFIALGLLIFAGVPVAVSVARSHLRAAPASAGVGLRVSRLDRGQLDLSWNRNAPELQRAHAAKLAISDGPLRQELNIDAAQLHLGRLIYLPQGSDVQFRLEILLDKQKSVTESVRVIAPAANLVASEAAPNRSSSQPAAPTRGTVTFVYSGPQDETSQRRFRSPELTTGRNQAQAPVHSIPSPDIPLEARHDAPLPVLSALPKPPASPVNAPVPAPAHPAVELQRGPVSTFVPPHPVREVMPDIHLLGPSVISTPARVAVRVRIDETGSVVEATPASDGKGINHMLISVAVNAARQWKFAPGLIHGKPVATDHTVIFEFRPRTSP